METMTTFFDADGNVVEEDKAVKAVIQTIDDSGHIVDETIAVRLIPGSTLVAEPTSPLSV